MVLEHPPGDGAASPPRFSIALIEDDAATACLVRDLLSKSGYGVRVASSVVEARRLFQSECADLVVLDRVLPDGDGLEIARELKAEGETGPYVLMLTAVSSEQAKIEALDGGADDYVTKPFAHAELLARVRAGLRMVELQRALLAANRRLEVLSTTDALTGAHNRRWFDENLDRSFAQAVRYTRPLSIALVDADFFKQVNDAHGHAGGDAVLRELSSRVAGTLRRADSIARIGGEEFAVLLPETGLSEAFLFAEKIRAAVAADPFDAGGTSVPLTISVGVAGVPHSNLAVPSQLLGCADSALYRAKSGGRNRVELERRAEPFEPRTRGPRCASTHPRARRSGDCASV